MGVILSLRLFIEFILTLLIFIEESRLITKYDLLAGEISNFSKQANDNFRRLILNSYLKPMPMYYERQLTYYDKIGDISLLSSAVGNQIPKDGSSFILLYRLLENNYLGIIVIILAILFFGDNYSLEFYNGKQFEFLRTQPISRRKVYISKYFSGLYGGCKFIGILILFVVLIRVFHNPLKTLNYPIMKYIGLVKNPMADMDFSNFFNFIPFWIYLFESVTMILLNFMFIYSMLQMFWIISYKKYLVYSSTLAVILILLLIALFYPNLGSYNPITYFKLLQVAYR